MVVVGGGGGKLNVAVTGEWKTRLLAGIPVLPVERERERKYASSGSDWRRW